MYLLDLEWTEAFVTERNNSNVNSRLRPRDPLSCMRGCLLYQLINTRLFTALMFRSYCTSDEIIIFELFLQIFKVVVLRLSKSYTYWLHILVGNCKLPSKPFRKCIDTPQNRIKVLSEEDLKLRYIITY